MSTATTEETLTVEDLEFALRRSSRRRTVQITVERDGGLMITAPPDCPTETIAELVREKRFWIYTKLAEKEALQHPTPKKSFVTGEGFPYLGRRYRLLLVDEQDVPLKLEHGRFKLLRTEAENGREHFIKWYRKTGRLWLKKRVPRFNKRIGVEARDLRVRDLGYRWGSCSANGGVNFHWATLLFPPSIVDYVIVHELVHLKVRHHTPEFWQRVERAMPDYERRKKWLAERGGREVGW